MGLVAKIQPKKNGRQDQSAYNEDCHPDHNIEHSQMQQPPGGQEGKEGLRNVIKAYGHTT